MSKVHDTKDRLLVVGNGMASVRLLEALMRRDSRRFSITVVGAEPYAGYNRVLLSALLAKDVAQEDIVLKRSEWYRDNGIDLVLDDPVVAVNASLRSATLRSGRDITFDQCVFATGSDAFRLPIPGIDKRGVITFRDLSDVAAMEKAITRKSRVAVIGGGLLGIEAAYGLAKRGVDVTLVHVMDRLMERQLDAPAAALLKRALHRRKVKVLLERQTVAITGEEAATGLAFADGSFLDADIVVCAVGIKPNAAVAKAAGLLVNRGILIGDDMAASQPGFYAIGECAEHRGIAYGLVEPAYAQAETLAGNLLGDARTFEGMVLSTNLKVSGVPVFSAGYFMGSDKTVSAVVEDRHTGLYRKLVFEGDTLVGCVLVGDAEDGLWYLDLMRRGVDISSARRELVYGRSFAQELLHKRAVTEEGSDVSVEIAA